MTRADELLAEVAASGELDRQLREQYGRWAHLWSFAEFRDTVVGRAWERREQFRGETAGAYLGWVRQVAWSAAADRARAEGRLDRLRRRLAALLPRAPDPPADAVEARDLVGWLLAGLTDRERRLLVLKYFEDKSTDELAAALGATPGAVHQLHFRALAKLRARAGGENPDRPP